MAILVCDPASEPGSKGTSFIGDRYTSRTWELIRRYPWPRKRKNHLLARVRNALVFGCEVASGAGVTSPVVALSTVAGLRTQLFVSQMGVLQVELAIRFVGWLWHRSEY